jgi:hypothetical protein
MHIIIARDGDAFMFRFALLFAGFFCQAILMQIFSDGGELLSHQNLSREK